MKKKSAILALGFSALLLGACSTTDSPAAPKSSCEPCAGKCSTAGCAVDKCANPACECLPAGEAVDVDVAGASSLIAKGKVTVLDIRTEAEFAAGHIPGAMQIDFKSADFGQKIAALDPKKTYLLHCKSGGRSTQALAVLKKAGITLYHLPSGLDAWVAAGGKTR